MFSRAQAYSSNLNDRRILALVFGALFIATAAYLLFLSVSVFAAVGRGTAERRIDEVTARRAPLEAEYVAMVGKIGPAFAYEHGFVDVSEPRYIGVTDAPKTFTLRE